MLWISPRTETSNGEIWRCLNISEIPQFTSATWMPQVFDSQNESIISETFLKLLMFGKTPQVGVNSHDEVNQ